jgi:hypothetical protein
MPSEVAGMFDNVVVRSTPETVAAGIAGLKGQVHGVTTPSSTEIEYLGDHSTDCALNVHFATLDKDFWLAPDLIEFLDHAEGTAIRVGEGPEMVRQADGTWKPSG